MFGEEFDGHVLPTEDFNRGFVEPVMESASSLASLKERESHGTATLLGLAETHRLKPVLLKPEDRIARFWGLVKMVRSRSSRGS